MLLPESGIFWQIRKIFARRKGRTAPPLPEIRLLGETADDFGLSADFVVLLMHVGGIRLVSIIPALGATEIGLVVGVVIIAIVAVVVVGMISGIVGLHTGAVIFPGSGLTASSAVLLHGGVGLNGTAHGGEGGHGDAKQHQGSAEQTCKLFYDIRSFS